MGAEQWTIIHLVQWLVHWPLMGGLLHLVRRLVHWPLMGELLHLVRRLVHWPLMGELLHLVRWLVQESDTVWYCVFMNGLSWSAFECCCCEADFKLMMQNCMQYNRPDTVYHREAKRLLSIGLKHLSRVGSLFYHFPKLLTNVIRSVIAASRWICIWIILKLIVHAHSLL